MSAITELAVDMHCQSCVETVNSALSTIPGITSVSIHLGEKRVVIEGTSPYLTLVTAIRDAGLDVAVVGQSSTIAHLGAGVAQFTGPLFIGVVCFVQLTPSECSVEVDIQGKEDCSFGITQFGDLRDNFTRLGSTFQIPSFPEEYLSNLGSHCSSRETKIYKSKEIINGLELSNIIGRTVCIKEFNKTIVDASVIVRSAGVQENLKRVCACDGTSIWESSR